VHATTLLRYLSGPISGAFCSAFCSPLTGSAAQRRGLCTDSHVLISSQRGYRVRASVTHTHCPRTYCAAPPLNSVSEHDLQTELLQSLSPLHRVYSTGAECSSANADKAAGSPECRKSKWILPSDVNKCSTLKDKN